jgi:predicted ATP-binding protein involved in virulence
MEERAKRREEMRLARIERQREKEEERRTVAAVAAEAVENDKRESRKEAIRRRRELKQEEEDRQREEVAKKEQTVANKLRSEAHHRLSLLNHYGFAPWRSMVCSNRDHTTHAVAHSNSTVLRRGFLLWRCRTAKAVAEQETRADSSNASRIARGVFNAWYGPSPLNFPRFARPPIHLIPAAML